MVSGTSDRSGVVEVLRTGSTEWWEREVETEERPVQPPRWVPHFGCITRNRGDVNCPKILLISPTQTFHECGTLLSAVRRLSSTVSFVTLKPRSPSPSVPYRDPICKY